ncbi:hypothetical protein M8C21_028249, partial [Ambrosia artemisiifolia]
KYGTQFSTSAGRGKGEGGGRGSGRGKGEGSGRGSEHIVREGGGRGSGRSVGEGGGRGVGGGRGGGRSVGEGGGRSQLHQEPNDDDEPVAAVDRGLQCYRWEDKSESLIYSCWEKCIKGKFPDLLKRAWDNAKTLANQEGVELGNDLTPLLPFKPLWISQESWGTLVEAWNTDSWKGKSSQNSENRGKTIGGRYTLGSKSFVTVRKNMEKTMKWRAKFEEIIQEHNLTWVDTRASEAYRTYNKYVIEKYGEDTSLHPEIDMELWSQIAGATVEGKNSGNGKR